MFYFSHFILRFVLIVTYVFQFENEQSSVRKLTIIQYIETKMNFLRSFLLTASLLYAFIIKLRFPRGTPISTTQIMLKRIN